ncbi:MAG: hypothetical protein ACRDOL_01860 [Streptosporangiaceae bacterium]
MPPVPPVPLVVPEPPVLPVLPVPEGGAGAGPPEPGRGAEVRVVTVDTSWLAVDPAVSVAVDTSWPAAEPTAPVTVDTSWPAGEPEAPVTEVTAVPAAVTTPVAVLVSVLVIPPAAVWAVVTTPVTVTVDAGRVEVAVWVVVVTVACTVWTAEPSRPPGEGWVAALAGPASSRPMPNAAHRPPIAAPQVYKNTLRVSRHQPFTSATLIYL